MNYCIKLINIQDHRNNYAQSPTPLIPLNTNKNILFDSGRVEHFISGRKKFLILNLQHINMERILF